MNLRSAHALHDLFVKGEVSAQEILLATFESIAKHDAQVGAFLSLFQERALDKAVQLDQKRARGAPLGKLAAVPIALKDNINLQGTPLTCGSRILSRYTSVFSATAAQLIEAEDGLIVGKTNLDEFAMGSSTENSAFQLTRNPWNLACSPGGSSGGSAAAVAAGLCPLALGSDTGGSIRQPASFCGVVGFKPSYGRVSRHGLVAFGSSLDQIGPLSHRVIDAALLLDVISQPCRYDSTSLPRGYAPSLPTVKSPPRPWRIGVPWRFLEGLKKEARRPFENALSVLKSLGCRVVDVDLDLLRYSIAVYYILATAEASTNLARFDGIRYGQRSPHATSVEEVFDLSRQEGFGAEVKRRILLGTYVLSAGYQDAYYKKAQKVRTLLIEQYRKAFATCDLIATPTSPFTAFEIGKIQDPLQMYLQDVYTVPVNLAGLTAVSIPCGLSQEHLPLGLHLTAPFLHDAEVLHCAAAFENATPEMGRIPPHFQG